MGSVYHARSSTSAASKTINELLLKQLLPKYASILSGNDPLPTFGLKLLSTIFEANIAFVGVTYKLKLIAPILEFYSGTLCFVPSHSP